MIKIRTNSCTVYMEDDGCWFRFAGEPYLRLVVPPNEENFSYAHGSKQYREACEAIASYKEEVPNRLENE